jgi:hypothetical protein
VKTPTGHDPFEDLPLPDPDEPSAEAPAPPARGRLRAVTADDDDPILRSSTGVIQPCELNALTFLKRAKQYEDIYWDDFLQRIRVGERDFLDGDVIAVQLWLQESTRQARFSRGHTQAAITSMAMERRRDSLIDYVESLKFLDAGTSIDTAFIEAWGAEDTPLTRAASRNFFIALVARALKPGVQVDTLWAFEGPQGCGKSQALRALGGVLHAEVGADIGTTDFMRELRGIWRNSPNSSHCAGANRARSNGYSACRLIVSSRNSRNTRRPTRGARSRPQPPTRRYTGRIRLARAG